MREKDDEVKWDICLQITEEGKKRLAHIRQRYVLQTMIEQLPIGKTVFSILKCMDNRDIMTVQQLFELHDEETKLDDNINLNLVDTFAKGKVSQRLFLRAIKRCIKKGYLVKVVTVGS